MSEPEPTPLVRWSARAVALAVVLPVRAVWDALGAVGRVLEVLWDRCVMRPFAALCAVLHRVLLRPLGRLLLIPLTALWHAALRPLVEGLARMAAFLCVRLVVLPARWLWPHVLVPSVRALAWLLRPAWQVLVWAWRVSGALLAPVGRALRTAWRVTTAPVRQAWREVSREVGDVLRRAFGPR